MPELSLPFDSIAGDEREYPAEQFVRYLAPLINPGIHTDPDTLKVEAVEGMTVQVNTGYAWINGYVYDLYDVPLPVTLSNAHNTLDRIDRIVLRLDLSLPERSIRVRVEEGEPASNPIPPTLTRDDNVYEFSLAQVRVVGGRSFIESTDITDERGDDELCPLVSSDILPSIDDALQGVIDKLDNLKITSDEGIFHSYNAAVPIYRDTNGDRWDCSDEDSDNIYVAGVNGNNVFLTAIRKSTMTQLWRVSLMGTSRPPIALRILEVGNKIAVLTQDSSSGDGYTYRVFVRNKTNGSSSGSINDGTTIVSLGSDENDNLYIGRVGDSNQLACYSVSGNSPVLSWQATTGSSYYSVHAISRKTQFMPSGFIYVLLGYGGSSNVFAAKFSLSSRSTVWETQISSNQFGVSIFFSSPNATSSNFRIYCTVGASGSVSTNLGPFPDIVSVGTLNILTDSGVLHDSEWVDFGAYRFSIERQATNRVFIRNDDGNTVLFYNNSNNGLVSIDPVGDNLASIPSKPQHRYGSGTSTRPRVGLANLFSPDGKSMLHINENGSIWRYFNIGYNQRIE